MKVIALDTSSGMCSVALQVDGKSSYSESSKKYMQSEELIPMMMSLCKDHCISLLDLDYIVCTTGPGSFTGIRIGIAAARGIKKLAPHIKAIGISNLEVIAHEAMITKSTNTLSQIKQCKELATMPIQLSEGHSDALMCKNGNWYNNSSASSNPNTDKGTDIIALIKARPDEFYMQRFTGDIEMISDICVVDHQHIKKEQECIVAANDTDADYLDGLSEILILNINAESLLERFLFLVKHQIIINESQIYPIYVKQPNIG